MPPLSNFRAGPSEHHEDHAPSWCKLPAIKEAKAPNLSSPFAPGPRSPSALPSHDLAAITRSEHYAAAISDHAIASTGAQHKSHFFIEKDMNGEIIDYIAATMGKLKLVPDGDARAALAKDHEAMMADDVVVGDALPFDALLDACKEMWRREMMPGYGRSSKSSQVTPMPS